MQLRRKTIAIGVLALLLIAIYLFTGISSNWDYILPSRGMKVLSIIVTGGAIAFSTVIFQTITTNRILTPSILGLDSMYLLVQTGVIFWFGSGSIVMMDSQLNYLLSVGAMIIFSFLLFKWLFRRGENVYLLLLVGIILGTFFSSLSSFMQVLIDPNEFMMVRDRMFASFNNINTDLLWISILLMLIAFVSYLPLHKYIDVMALGKDQAVNLGVPYDKVVKRLLIIVAILISVATALVGPITFLGLLVVNLAHEFMKTYKHRYLFLVSILFSIVALVGGQLIVERIFTFSTTISVLINFIGGIYFIYLLLRENKA
ncbi:iron chelate uptake ABC transporter family permease subunit [Halobacillus shinanisalinarum]|uniref:Iron chelate uptake ABC transporter family permease subunit n=1 Tax=Halobacillus shinanisalinarum TaxID=2932258 RepID=A0ABY4GTY1_9BACI|nr:iron chelate uptake ABC transporter family permease subunit [Halobacillus shinanisalinarum]UOQ91613.1 iron chelate uptake ABC transporter family permease subunit [Halobacillus shinanisalinarum]